MLCDRRKFFTNRYLVVYNAHLFYFEQFQFQEKLNYDGVVLEILNCEFEAFKLQISFIWHDYLTYQSIKLCWAISTRKNTFSSWKVSAVNLIFLFKKYRRFSNEEMSFTVIYCQPFPSNLNHWWRLLRLSPSNCAFQFNHYNFG